MPPFDGHSKGKETVEVQESSCVDQGKWIHSKKNHLTRRFLTWTRSTTVRTTVGLEDHQKWSRGCSVQNIRPKQTGSFHPRKEDVSLVF
uniref:Uncharacterized protein n=1 Tax=Lepeophtheirus salmonis TaxID=72036 RepID=A0A0K2U7U7_LEPSM